MSRWKAFLQFKLSRAQEARLRSALPDWVELVLDDEPGHTEVHLRDTEILLHVLRPVTSAMIGEAPRLQMIQKIGVGINTIDMAAARIAGVRVANMPGTNSQAVAEHTLMLMLSVLRKVCEIDAAVHTNRGWALNCGLFDGVGEISGRVVGFVGFGEVPSRLAPALNALGARVIFCMSRRESTVIARRRSLEELLSEADILSLHVPLTEATRNLINAGSISAMKRSAILINTARGGLIDQPSLSDALTHGRIAGAGLDVMQIEPIPADDALMSLRNVVLTPHVAWLTNETLTRSFSVIAENCRRLRSGEALLNEIST